MKIGVLGTGMVGDAIASKLVALGHEVMMGSRDAHNAKATAWVKRVGARAKKGTFADTASFGEVLFNCTRGANSLEVLGAVGQERLAGKILIDIANILQPELRRAESLGEQIQATFPKAKVVKALNTMNCSLMVDPAKLSESHTVFMSGNDGSAKKTSRELLAAFGWKDIIDLGDITTARALESYLALWLGLWKALGTAQFNIKVVRS